MSLTRAAGALHPPLLQGEDVAKIKDRLLEPTFGQGAKQVLSGVIGA